MTKQIAFRSEKATVNTLRLLAELFAQPSLRHSEGLLRLLLPPLMSPLLEALYPARCRFQHRKGFHSVVLCSQNCHTSLSQKQRDHNISTNVLTTQFPFKR